MLRDVKPLRDEVNLLREPGDDFDHFALFAAFPMLATFAARTRLTRRATFAGRPR